MSGTYPAFVYIDPGAGAGDCPKIRREWKRRHSVIEALRKNRELWRLYCRTEEYESRQRDEFSRFPFTASSSDDIQRPKVSEYLYESGFRPAYPDGKRFALCLTHDIDYIRHGLVRGPYRALRTLLHRRPSAAGRILFSQTIGGGALRDFEAIMDLEARYQAVSSFYFLALEPGEPDFNFRLDEVQEQLREIAARGWEVGLHGGHRAFRDADVLLREKERLETVVGREVVGYRNHYLRFVVPDTWNLLSRAGFLYDTTLGYAEMPGFRNGMCHPYQPYDLNQEKEVQLLELPLAVMDVTFSGYLHLDQESSWHMIRKMIDCVAGLAGVLTVLWHNNTLANDSAELYERILAYGVEKNAWLTSGERIASWWSARAQTFGTAS